VITARLTTRLRFIEPHRTETLRSLRTIAAGHAFVQNLRRAHYELSVDVPAHDRILVAFAELTLCR
jgi:hypothetical protein